MMWFLTLLKGIGLKVWGYVAAGLAVLSAVAMIFRAGKRSAQIDGLQKQLENVEKANEIEDRIDRATPDERKRLRDKWTRP